MPKISKLPRIHFPDNLLTDDSLTVDGNKFNHFKNVLRFKEGSSLRVFNEMQGEFEAVVSEIKSRSMKINIVKQLRNFEKSQSLTLAISLIKIDKLLLAIRACCALGVTKFVPLITEYSQIEKFNKERIERCIIESVEQCERLDIPELTESIKIKDFISKYSKSNSFIANETEASSRKLIDIDQKYFISPIILIGPEGGFSQKEIDFISSSKNSISFSLGENVLRSEFAAISAVSCLQMLRK